MRAVICDFMRSMDDKTERGIAIVGDDDQVIAIFPPEATTFVDALSSVWWFNLEWHRGTLVLPKEDD